MPFPKERRGEERSTQKFIYVTDIVLTGVSVNCLKVFTQ